MTRKKNLKALLIACLFFLALGGWLLHLRVHTPGDELDDYVPFITGIFSVFVLPVLFSFKKTLSIAYLVNGMIAIIGTITMAHFSIVKFEGPATFLTIMINTTIADIAILWGKFAIGKAIYDLEFLHNDNETHPKGRFIRYPNMGFWLIHLAVLSAVYALGNILWK